MRLRDDFAETNWRFLKDTLMYAIILDGGRQHKVAEGESIVLDYRDASAGDAIQFDQVIAFSGDDGMKLGAPLLSGVLVSGEVIGVRQGPKLVVQKFRRRKTLRRKTGHRQIHTEVRIKKIELS